MRNLPTIAPGTTIATDAANGRLTFLTVLERSKYIAGAWECVVVEGEPKPITLAGHLLDDAAKAEREPCAANTPVTWGELYLVFSQTHPDIAEKVLVRMLEIDSSRAA